MKRIVLLLFCYSLIFTGCSKDSDFISSAHQEASFNGIKKIQLTDGGRSLSSEMLVFTNYNHYVQTVKLLDSLVEEHDDAFLNDWGHLDDDALNQKEDDIGHVYYQPLIDFENNLNFNFSMRSAYQQDEDSWMGNQDLILSDHPSYQFPYSLSQMTLLNSNGEVLIGDSILILTSEGFIQIDSAETSLLNRIREGDTTVLSEPNVRTSIGYRNDCRLYAQKGEIDFYNNVYAVILRVRFTSWPWHAASVSKIISYKWNGNKWKKCRRKLEVGNQSYMRDRFCFPKDSGWSGWKVKRRKSLRESNPRLGPIGEWKAENGQSVEGHFKYAGNYSILNLTW